MIFTPRNTNRASVFDVDTKQEIKHVSSIDTEAMDLICYEQPFRVHHDHAATYTIKYRAIHPIYAGRPWPCLFHCYGKIE